MATLLYFALRILCNVITDRAAMLRYMKAGQPRALVRRTDCQLQYQLQSIAERTHIGGSNPRQNAWFVSAVYADSAVWNMLGPLLTFSRMPGSKSSEGSRGPCLNEVRVSLSCTGSASLQNLPPCAAQSQWRTLTITCFAKALHLRIIRSGLDRLFCSDCDPTILDR